MHIRLLLLLALLLCAADPGAAARLSERSPVRMGMWWDPRHDGSGVELFRAGGEIALIWYTYRDDGAPVWYAASAAFAADGSWRSPLYRHAWAGGSAAAPDVVGALELRRDHHEQLSMHWSLDGREGSERLQPFPVSGIVPEVDHSGAWFDTARPGFGLGLTEQGEWLASTLYFYDAGGAPTWRIGDNGGHGTALTLRGLTGTCPGCDARELKTIDQGALSLRFDAETQMHARYEAADGAAWTLDGPLQQISAPASSRPADRQLAEFDDETRLRGYLDAALVSALPMYPPGIDFSPPPLTTSFSTTNVQEAGVDEADRLKSDGRWLYAIDKDEQRRDRAALRIAEVRDEGAQLVLHGRLALPAGEQPIGHSGLYLTDSRLVTLQGSAATAWGSNPLWLTPQWWTDGSTRVAAFDRTRPEAPAALWNVEFDGHLVASRRIGDRLFLVLRQTSQVPGLAWGSDEATTRARLAGVPTAALMPRMRSHGGEWQPLLQPSQVHLPVVGSLQASPEFISIVALDLDATLRWKAMAVVGAVSAVYVSPGRMYVATSRSSYEYDATLGFHPGGQLVTDVHEIALDAEGPRFSASGTLEGFLDRDPDRAMFRFSEHEGRLRAVTVSPLWGALGHNRVTVLERSSITPGLLKTVAYLPNRERPAPLGKPDEMLYGTRFVGDRLYAVTFLKTDPLYVVDLSRPAAPRIAGEVELPGFSDYLHPVGENLLLGVGLDARPAINGWGDTRFAWFQGLLFSLFDVADPSQPRLLQQLKLGKRGSGSALLRSHHALSVLPGNDRTTFGLPVRVHDSSSADPPVPSDHYSYAWSWSGLQTLDVQGTTSADARLVPGLALITHRRASGSVEPQPDDAVDGARAVQFARGIVYVENGRFWRADPATMGVSGPF